MHFDPEAIRQSVGGDSERCVSVTVKPRGYVKCHGCGTFADNLLELSNRWCSKAMAGGDWPVAGLTADGDWLVSGMRLLLTD